MRSKKEAGAGGDERRQGQQQLMTEVVAKKLNPSSIPKINSIFKLVEDNVKTDLSVTDLNVIRSDNNSAQKNVTRLTLNTENALGDDGLYYFYPSNHNQIGKDYKDNLHSK